MPEELYREALALDLRSQGFVAREAAKLPAVYLGQRLRRRYEVDILVDEKLVIETKATAVIAPIHVAQTLGYLRMANLQVAMIYNFNVELFKLGGFKRIINPHYDPDASALFSFASVPSVSKASRPERPDAIERLS